MPRLANYLANERGVDRPVIDRTGLPGAYGFALTYAMNDKTDAPDIVTAVREQLGLRLLPIRTKVRLVVIDHVQRPSPN
jgi:uncharacterized protein (TIGR03435 family)